MIERVSKKAFHQFFKFTGKINDDEEAHFPKNDLIDENSGSQCFFHRHKSLEIGSTQHFHFFRNWVPSIKEIDGRMMTTHIAALEVGQSFEPISWFTLNQWVTGNYFLLSDDLKALCANFNFNSIKNSKNKEIVLWLEEMFKDGVNNYFDNLIFDRDKNLENIHKIGEDNLLENKNFEVLSRIFIN